MAQGTTRRSDRPTPLTQTELRVLAEFARGRSLSQIAASMYLSERSVRRRLRVACDAFGVETTIEAVVVAVRRGLLCGRSTLAGAYAESPTCGGSAPPPHVGDSA